MEPALSDCPAKLTPSIVDGFVERTTGRVEPFGQDVDRHAPDHDGEKDLALMRAEVAIDRFLQRGEELSPLDILLRRRILIGDQRLGFRLERHFASLPGTAADVHSCFEQRELVCPGREAAVTSEVADLR